MKRFVVPFVLLLAATRLAAQTTDWSEFKPGTFAQVVQTERANLDFTPSTDGTGRINVSPVTWPQKVVVRYAGQHRPLSEGSQQVLHLWAGSIGHDSTWAGRFTNEYLFTENGVEYWVPVQTILETDLVREYQAGARVMLMARWLGTFHRTGKPQWVFVANGIDAPGIEAPPSQYELNGFLLGESAASLDSALGAPWRVVPHEQGGGSDRVYIIDRPHHAYMAFTFDSGQTVAGDLQLSGAAGTKASSFLGIKLGTPRSEVEAKFGPPAGERHEDDVNVDLVWWTDRNYTLEIDSAGRVNSIRLEGYEGFRDAPLDSDLQPLPRLRADLASGQVDSLLAILAPDIEFYQGDAVTRYTRPPRTELTTATSPVRQQLSKVAGIPSTPPDNTALRVEDGATGMVYKWDHGPVQELFFKWFPGGYRLWEVKFR